MTQLARIPTVSLKPLSPELSPEVLTWATELRALFAATGLSINRFTHLHPLIDKGTVSRYLNGKRVPRDRWFLDTLMAVQEHAGRALTPAARDHLGELQLRALATAHPHEYRVRKASDELEVAVAARWEAERRAGVIEERLADRIRQVRELTADNERLRAERRRLDQEIAELTEQLRLASERGLRAEHRCRELEEILYRLDDQVVLELAAIDQDHAAIGDRVLVLAQQTADQAVSDGRRTADEILAQARKEAADILGRAARRGMPEAPAGRPWTPPPR